MSLPLKCLVIIPTYNEIENVEDIIRATFTQGSHLEVLIVDDNSPDGTSDRVIELQKEFPDRLHLLKRSGKLGLATAYIEGFRYGLDKNFDYIFEMDADFSHNPNDLNRLLEACTKRNADVAVGSRYVKNGGITNWPLNRLILSYGASVYVRLVTWMPIKDPTAGFICYSHKVLEALNLNENKFSGYAFQIEMKYKAYQKGFIIEEVPIIFTDRKKGISKMNANIVKEAIKGVLGLRFKSLRS
jgi:dolichol-phosphate mannosyltransferase